LDAERIETRDRRSLRQQFVRVASSLRRLMRRIAQGRREPRANPPRRRYSQNLENGQIYRSTCEPRAQTSPPSPFPGKRLAQGRGRTAGHGRSACTSVATRFANQIPADIQTYIQLLPLQTAVGPREDRRSEGPRSGASHHLSRSQAGETVRWGNSPCLSP
jgi:hypothetical protein